LVAERHPETQNRTSQQSFPWIGVNELHHDMSHKPDGDAATRAKLIKVNRWYAGEVSYFLERMDSVVAGRRQNDARQQSRHLDRRAEQGEQPQPQEHPVGAGGLRARRRAHRALTWTSAASRTTTCW
jgi:hypothetical protein